MMETLSTNRGLTDIFKVVEVTWVSEKYPHGRGEDIPASSCLILVRETPPRAWGRQALWD
ncbi:MAG: hypothetical protein ABW148_17045 [Sedimenticola sp.]